MNMSIEELNTYFIEFIKARSEVNVEEPDYDQIENSNKIFNEKLLEYFSELTKVSIDKITKLTPEELYTMKQFLKDKYLSATDVEMLLKETDFKAAYSNVNEKIKRLNKLGFIKKFILQAKDIFLNLMEEVNTINLVHGVYFVF